MYPKNLLWKKFHSYILNLRGCKRFRLTVINLAVLSTIRLHLPVYGSFWLINKFVYKYLLTNLLITLQSNVTLRPPPNSNHLPTKTTVSKAKFQLIYKHKLPLNSDQHWPQFWGPKGGRCTQFWLYIMKTNLLINQKEP